MYLALAVIRGGRILRFLAIRLVNSMEKNTVSHMHSDMLNVKKTPLNMQKKTGNEIYNLWS